MPARSTGSSGAGETSPLPKSGLPPGTGPEQRLRAASAEAPAVERTGDQTLHTEREKSYIHLKDLPFLMRAWQRALERRIKREQKLEEAAPGILAISPWNAEQSAARGWRKIEIEF